MPIGRDVASWARASAAVPASVPAKPFPVWLGPPFNQHGRSDVFRGALPFVKVYIELAGDDFLKGKDFLRVLLINIGTQDQPSIRSLPHVAAPGAHRHGTFARLQQVSG